MTGDTEAKPCTRDLILFDLYQDQPVTYDETERRATRLSDDVSAESWELAVSPPILVSGRFTVDRITASQIDEPLRFLCDEWYDGEVSVRLRQPYYGEGKLKRTSTLGRDDRLRIVLGLLEEYLSSHDPADLFWETQPELRRLDREASRIRKDAETPPWAEQQLRDLGLWNIDTDWIGAIEAFARREGHLEIPAGHVEDGVRVDLALEHYRALVEAESVGIRSLPRDVVRRIETLPGWQRA